MIPKSVATQRCTQAFSDKHASTPQIFAGFHKSAKSTHLPYKPQCQPLTQDQTHSTPALHKPISAKAAPQPQPQQLDKNCASLRQSFVINQQTLKSKATVGQTARPKTTTTQEQLLSLQQQNKEN